MAKVTDVSRDTLHALVSHKHASPQAKARVLAALMDRGLVTMQGIFDLLPDLMSPHVGFLYRTLSHMTLARPMAMSPLQSRVAVVKVGGRYHILYAGRALAVVDPEALQNPGALDFHLPGVLQLALFSARSSDPVQRYIYQQRNQMVYDSCLAIHTDLVVDLVGLVSKVDPAQVVPMFRSVLCGMIRIA